MLSIPTNPNAHRRRPSTGLTVECLALPGGPIEGDLPPSSPRLSREPSSSTAASLFHKNALKTFVESHLVREIELGLDHNDSDSDSDSDDELITVKDTDTVRAAVKTMTNFSVHSVPVVSEERGTIIGFLDMPDVASFICRVSERKASSQADVQDWADDADFADLVVDGKNIGNEQVKNMLGASGRNPLVSLHHSAPLYAAVEIFASGVKRALVLNEDNEVTKICSQSDVVRFLHAHKDEPALRGIMSKTLTELGFGSVVAEQEIISISSQTPVIGALRMLSEHQTHCVAIVHKRTGQLAGNFSASDVHGLYRELMPELTRPVKTYLKKHHHQSLSASTQSPDTPLGTVIDEMLTYKMQHFWIVDEDNVPKGIITQTDIMRIILHYDASTPDTPVVFPTPGNLVMRVVRVHPVLRATAGDEDGQARSDLPAAGNNARMRVTLGNLAPVVTTPVDFGSMVWDDEVIEVRVENYHVHAHMRIELITDDAITDANDAAAAAAAAPASDSDDSDSESVSSATQLQRLRSQKAHDVGVVAATTIHLDWVLNGFGTSNANLTFCRDNYHLRNRLHDLVANLTLEMTWRPAEEAEQELLYTGGW